MLPILSFLHSLLPSFTPLSDGWGRLYWDTGLFVIERAIPPESIACIRALCVVVPMLLIALAIQRMENYENDPRHK